MLSPHARKHLVPLLLGSVALMYGVVQLSSCLGSTHQSCRQACLRAERSCEAALLSCAPSCDALPESERVTFVECVFAVEDCEASLVCLDELRP